MIQQHCACFKKVRPQGSSNLNQRGYAMLRVGPESIEDIAAVNALYRPGPMQNIDTFIKRKKDKSVSLIQMTA